MTWNHALTQLDQDVDQFFSDGTLPGLVYAIVDRGEIVHSRGLGVKSLREGDGTPDTDTVFRIASMTKSFTAAAVLQLRDQGSLRLDDEVSDFVPELADLGRPTSDSPPLTVRHLLTMSAGFPTDDPWGDRQQGLEPDAFADLLKAGFSFAWPTGTQFEYANLGYAILGRVVAAAGGNDYRSMMHERILGPLGMTATSYSADEVPTDHLAVGYQHRSEGFSELPFDPFGAFAPMGGLFSSVRDLGRWVSGFIDAFPARDDPEHGHPLSRATRREMQQGQRMLPPSLKAYSPDSGPVVDAAAYGFGLFVEHDLRHGHLVSHSGGYPGFGSHMRWHPGTGLGIVALANRTYAPVARLCGTVFADFLAASERPARTVQATDSTRAAVAAVDRMLATWDDTAVDAVFNLFADNVTLDDPLPDRRRQLGALAAKFGGLTHADDLPQHSDSPFHRSWWSRGNGGRVRVDLLMSPHPRPLIQGLVMTEVPDPSEAMAAVADRLARLLQEPTATWPRDLSLAETVDAAALDLTLRSTAVRFGSDPITWQPTAGNGKDRASFRFASRSAAVQVNLATEGADNNFTQVAIVTEVVTAPA